MTLPGMKKPLKPIPVFKQMPGEKKKQFFRRMDMTVQVLFYNLKAIPDARIIRLFVADNVDPINQIFILGSYEKKKLRRKV